MRILSAASPFFFKFWSNACRKARVGGLWMTRCHCSDAQRRWLPTQRSDKQTLHQGPHVLQLSQDTASVLCCAWHFDSHTEIFTACTAFPYWYLVAEAFGIGCNLKAAFSSVYLNSALPAWHFKLSTSQWESLKHLTLQGTKFSL